MNPETDTPDNLTERADLLEREVTIEEQIHVINRKIFRLQVAKEYRTKALDKIRRQLKTESTPQSRPPTHVEDTAAAMSNESIR
jgi:hypothetical protein